MSRIRSLSFLLRLSSVHTIPQFSTHSDKRIPFYQNPKLNNFTSYWMHLLNFPRITTQSITTRFLFNQKSKQTMEKIKRASSNRCIKNKLIIDTVQFIWRSLIKFFELYVHFKMVGLKQTLYSGFENRERTCFYCELYKRIKWNFVL